MIDLEFGCKKYKDKIEDLTDELNREKQSLQATNQLLDAWKQDYRDLEYDRDLQISLLKYKLTKALSKSWEIPDISDFIKDRTQYDPWIDDRIDGLELEIADRFYYTFSDGMWKSILAKCYLSVRKAQETWVREVGDCDNWAEAMHYTVTNATFKATPRPAHQSAIAIAWSFTGAHAYNAFVANDAIYIYEPQNGEIKGKLGETPSPYETELLIFLS